MTEKQNFTTLLSKVILPKLEIIAVIISSIGFILYLLKQPGAHQLLMIGLSTLASAFFLTAYTLPPNVEKTLREEQSRTFTDLLGFIIWKVIYLALAVNCIGLLFSILQLKGFMQLLLIGTTTLIISLLLAGVIILQKNEYLPTFQIAIIKALMIALMDTYILYNNWPLTNS